MWLPSQVLMVPRHSAHQADDLLVWDDRLTHMLSSSLKRWPSLLVAPLQVKGLLLRDWESDLASVGQWVACLVRKCMCENRLARDVGWQQRQRPERIWRADVLRRGRGRAALALAQEGCAVPVRLLRLHG